MQAYTAAQVKVFDDTYNEYMEKNAHRDDPELPSWAYQNAMETAADWRYENPYKDWEPEDA